MEGLFLRNDLYALGQETVKILDWNSAVLRVQKDLHRVELELDLASDSPVRLVSDVCRHTLKAGGKRIRPALVLLSARAAGYRGAVDRVARLGACLEIIHVATLLHDDVIDNAQVRRGRPSAASIFGNTGAILSGDVLLAKAMVMLAQDGDLAIIRNVSEAVVEMAQGEARELELRDVFDLSAEDHFAVLRMKTAAFVECACSVGAMVAEAPAESVEALASFGDHIGMAFQIVDDVLDFRGESKKTGKTPGTDLIEGCATLPLILLREKLTEEERHFIQNRFGSTWTDDEIEMVIGWMETRGAFSEALAIAEDHACRAREALRTLPPSDARSALEALIDFVLARRH